MLDDATPHTAVPVQAIRDGEVMTTTLSDVGGRYRFVNLKPGQYQLRCQVLGGYVYYETTDDALPFTFYDSPDTEEDAGEVLSVEQGKTLNNIDFRFASFKKGTWKNYTRLNELASDWVVAIYRDPDGVLWFGTWGGVSHYDGEKFVTFTTRDSLAHDSVLAIHRDPDGVMWFGTGDYFHGGGGGVSRYDGDQFVTFTTQDGLADNTVHAIYCGEDGIVWFGTKRGLSCYDGKGFVNFTTKDGLANDSVLDIYRDLDGAMWFGTWDGVSRYAKPNGGLRQKTAERSEHDFRLGAKSNGHLRLTDGLANPEQICQIMTNGF